jgi:hypothetical protein
VLNIVLTLFCQDIEEEAERFEVRANIKGKNVDRARPLSQEIRSPRRFAPLSKFPTGRIA